MKKIILGIGMSFIFYSQAFACIGGEMSDVAVFGFFFFLFPGILLFFTYNFLKNINASKKLQYFVYGSYLIVVLGNIVYLLLPRAQAC